VDDKTGEELSLPFTRKDWKGEAVTVCRFTSRFIVTELNEPFLPSVVGARIEKVA
jgi:hypothetical protein